MAIFPCGPGLADIKMPPFWFLLELRIMEVVVRTGVISSSQIITNKPNPAFYRPDAIPVAQPTLSKQ